jgi:hypothetical protein
VPVSSKAGIRFPFIQTIGGARSLTIFEGVWDSEENEITYAITECGLKWKHRVQIAMASFLETSVVLLGMKSNLTFGK